jgi:hypothetical protein
MTNSGRKQPSARLAASEHAARVSWGDRVVVISEHHSLAEREDRERLTRSKKAIQVSLNHVSRGIIMGRKSSG